MLLKGFSSERVALKIFINLFLFAVLSLLSVGSAQAGCSGQVKCYQTQMGGACNWDVQIGGHGCGGASNQSACSGLDDCGSNPCMVGGCSWDSPGGSGPGPAPAPAPGPGPGPAPNCGQCRCQASPGGGYDACVPNAGCTPPQACCTPACTGGGGTGGPGPGGPGGSCGTTYGVVDSIDTSNGNCTVRGWAGDEDVVDDLTPLLFAFDGVTRGSWPAPGSPPMAVFWPAFPDPVWPDQNVLGYSYRRVPRESAVCRALGGSTSHCRICNTAPDPENYPQCMHGFEVEIPAKTVWPGYSGYSFNNFRDGYSHRLRIYIMMSDQSACFRGGSTEPRSDSWVGLWGSPGEPNNNNPSVFSFTCPVPPPGTIQGN